jgi:hypothetical protein
MRIGDVLGPADLKEINLLLLLEGAEKVGGSGELRRRVKARAKMVRDDKLAALLAEIPDVEQAEARGAWSHWMALVATRQPFFDANHRTALMAFNRAATKAWGVEYALPVKDLEAMMVGSRRLVQQAHRPGADAPRIATVAALRDPEHPVRRFYAGFEGALEERRPPT